MNGMSLQAKSKKIKNFWDPPNPHTKEWSKIGKFQILQIQKVDKYINFADEFFP